MAGHGLLHPADEDDDLVMREARGHDLSEGTLHAGGHVLQHSEQLNLYIISLNFKKNYYISINYYIA